MSGVKPGTGRVGVSFLNPTTAPIDGKERVLHLKGVEIAGMSVEVLAQLGEQQLVAPGRSQITSRREPIPKDLPRAVTLAGEQRKRGGLGQRPQQHPEDRGMRRHQREPDSAGAGVYPRLPDRPHAQRERLTSRRVKRR